MKRRKLILEDFKDLVRLNGGNLLSTIYISLHKPLIIRCAKGHEWKSCGSSLLHGSWCPYCSSGRCEELCRAYFEQIFQSNFPKVKPKWLRNLDTGYLMQLDGYSEELGIAFEHNGKQHYDGRFHKIIDRSNDKILLENSSRRDALKAKLCEENKVILVVIRELLSVTKLENLRSVIKTQLLLKGHTNFPHDFESKVINLSNVPLIDEIEKFKDIAKTRHGECLSKEYLGSLNKLEFRCKYSHVWLASPQTIKKGNWCPKCSKHAKKSIEHAKNIAKLKGGECLSNSYKSTSEKLLWMCKDGHKWEASYNSISMGSWCPISGGSFKKTLEDAKALASDRGGYCLSLEYINSSTKMVWKCNKEHVWSATFRGINSGKWCPVCGGSSRKTIEDAKLLAAVMGGECLSSNYQNNRTLLQWRCHKNHRWNSSYMKVRIGVWCKECKNS